MLEQEILEVEKKLLLHSKWLHKYLTDVNRVDDCLYIPLAGILRVLLCDSKFPILLKYSQELGIPLQIIGTPSIINEIPDNPPIAEFNFLGVGWDSAKRGYTMPVEEFLDTATGIIPIKLPNGSVKGSSYTPRQIIKWVSNKEGISHLDFDKPSAYETLKEVTFHSRNSEIEGILIQRLIYQIAKWAFIAINYVLEYSGIFEVIDNELNNLVSFEPIDLETLPIISIISYLNKE